MSLIENPFLVSLFLGFLLIQFFLLTYIIPILFFSSSYCKQKTHPPNICSISEVRPVYSALNLDRCMTRWIDWHCTSYWFVLKKKNNVTWIFTVLSSILLSVSWKTCHQFQIYLENFLHHKWIKCLVPPLSPHSLHPHLLPVSMQDQFIRAFIEISHHTSVTREISGHFLFISQNN